MARIRITPEEVRNVAAEFKKASETSQATINNLEAAVSRIQAEWEGVTKERFYAQYEEWRARMNQFVGLLNDINLQLGQIAQRFEAADQGA